MQTVAIVGVGLIGGSFALALKKAGFKGRILGVSSERSVREALTRGAIDEAATLSHAAAHADLIYLSQPVSRIIETIAQLEDLVKPEALVTDAGSTKAAIHAAAARHLTRCRFLGGHPMAGKEKRGVSEADPFLFTGRTYVLTPGSPEDLEGDLVHELVEWVLRIGATPFILPPDEHDALVAFTSHLPQLVSTALASTVAARLDSPDRIAVAGSGLNDMTRLAASAYDIWRDIIDTNTDAIDAALAAYIARLETIRASLRSSDLESEFGQGADFASHLKR
ncbi:MAG: prephenate dehydrogenase [Bryobacteraceae bacterium]